MESLGRLKGQVDPAFWKGKRVFVTGHTGFKGGWLTLWLQEMGAIIKGFALEPNTKPNLFTQAKIGEILRLEILPI
jgi:CDP-glucose 4,6-dehydratase